MADKKSRRTAVTAMAAAAVITVGGVCFGALFYRNAPRSLTAAEVIHREADLPDITFSGTADNISKADETSSLPESSRTDSSSQDSSERESSLPESLPRTESRTPAASDDSRSGNIPQSTETVYTSAESSLAENSSLTDESRPAPTAVQAVPDAGTPAKTAPSGKEADREYFTTSINDGETVSESVYFFTIEHLVKELEVVRCDVELNGSVLTGYAGKCRLKEGENSIRVSCTYKDGDNRVYRAFRDYTVNLVSPDSAIYTDLTDCDVFESVFSFTAECEDGLSVWLNGIPVEGDGRYTVTLSEGENMIRLSSGRRELNFSVTYIPLRELDIITDLTDCTVYGSELVFTAQAVGSSPKLTVQLNGKTLRGDGGIYTAALNDGRNSIRLLARDGAKRVEKTFTVTCLPTDEEGRSPYIAEINLTDNMTVKGSSYSLSLKAADYEGGRIYADGIEVACGGASAERRWEDSQSTGYLLKLHAGENSVYIRLKDSIGRTAEFFYSINCEAAGIGEEVGRISIKAQADILGLGVLCEDDSYPVLEGETGFDTIVRFLRDNGFEVSSRGSENSRYLDRIYKEGRFAGGALSEEALAYTERAGISINGGKDDDSLGEFDYTAGSGWLYSRGGRKPSYAMSAAVFADGEDIELSFSLDFGNDVVK